MKDKSKRQTFARLCELYGPVLSVFILCAVLDVPFIAERAEDTRTWDEYEDSLPGGRAFTDGEIDVNVALLHGADQHENWNLIWGSGYSDQEYKRLDQLYRMAIEPLVKDGYSIGPQQQHSAQEYAKLILMQDQSLAEARDSEGKSRKERVSEANELSKMAREKLKDSNMRAADVLPQQKQRPDGIVDALRRKYGVGSELTKDQFLQIFFEWCNSHNHPQTVDAEEHALLEILRCMQKNDDLPEPSELPETMRLDKFKKEFAQEPNERENEVYRYLGYVREDRMDTTREAMMDAMKNGSFG